MVNSFFFEVSSWRIDMENIAKVIAENTGKNVSQVTDAMLKRTTLNPDQAKDWGLVNTIQTELFPEGAKVVSITYNPNQVQVSR